MLVFRNDRICVFLAAPFLETGFHLRNNGGLLPGIVDALDKFFTATLARSIGHELANAGAGGSIGILILGDVEALSAGILDGGNYFIRVAPGRIAGELD